MQSYGDLKTEVAVWLNREDELTISRIPTFVQLAETEMYRGLRVEDNSFKAVYRHDEWYIEGSDPEPVSDGIVNLLPPNFLSLKLITWNGVPLQSVTDFELQVRLASQYDFKPAAFCITARRIDFSQSVPSNPEDWKDTDELVISYYGEETLLVSDDDGGYIDSATTHMLQRNPDIYLNGSLYYAGLFLQDDELAKKWGTLFNAALSKLKAESNANRYAGGTKQVRSAH